MFKSVYLSDRRVSWAGHVVRMDDKEFPKKDTVDKSWKSMRTLSTEIKMD